MLEDALTNCEKQQITKLRILGQFLVAQLQADSSVVSEEMASLPPASSLLACGFTMNYISLIPGYSLISQDLFKDERQ